jgi:GNAT superfamily N-acetyltransferase
MYTQQDVLEKIENMVAQYDYTVDNSGTSCNSTYIGITSFNTLIGCIGIEKNVIKHLRVKKEFKRNFIGTKLLHEAEKLIRKRNYKSYITYVHYKNKIALKFFRKQGYYIMWCGDYYYALEKWLE